MRLPASAGRLSRQLVLDRAVDARQLAEERVVVIGEAVGDLVDHPEPRQPQHVGAPEDEDHAAQLLVVARQLDVVALQARDARRSAARSPARG